MSELPRLIMNRVAWSLTGQPYTDRAAFEADVRQYHIDILDSDERWKPDELVIPAPRIGVAYEGLDEQAMALDERYMELDAASPEGFTALDLLFQVHNAVVEELSKIDHHFFEGFSLSSTGSEIPCYRLHQGS